MPGITGIIGRGPCGERRAMLDAMIGCMTRERSDGSGTYVNESLGVWVGWTSRDGPGDEPLPVWNDTHDVCLVFSGQDFTDRARDGGSEPPAWRALVHRYDDMGPAFLETLNGWFSGLIADLRERKVLLFNDRYGLKRLYCHEGPEALYFASEAKSLLRVLPGARRIDAMGLGEFFTCGCVLQNRTLFTGVSLLPGGSMWTSAPGAPARKDTYFTKERWEREPRLTREEHYEALKTAFARILPRYVGGEQRIAVSLTGGLDTRLILAWAPPPPGGWPCYTFGGMYRDSADVRIAREVARICGYPHRVIRLDRDFFSEFPALAAKAVRITDGALDVGGAVDLYVSRRAREIAPIRVTGNYGSEILRGTIAFKPAALRRGVFDGGFTSALDAAAATYASERRGRRLSFIAFKQVAWHHHGRFALEDSQLSQRSPYLDNELVALQYRAPDDVAADGRLCLRLVADGNPGLAAVDTDRGLGWGEPSVGARTRRLYQELTFKAEYAYDQGMPPWLARVDRVLRSLHVERLFRGRHKFAHFRTWYRDELARYVREVLLDPRTLARPYLCGAQVEEVVRRHAAGTENWTLEIHRLLTMELLQRQLIEHA